MKTANSEFVRSHNKSMLLTNPKGQFLSCIFDGADGVYYDAIGDEIFYIFRLGVGDDDQIIYKIVFSDHETIGSFKDHGFNEFLGVF